MTMTMEQRLKIEDAKVCVVCGGHWTMQTKVEKYCDKCKSHLLQIEDELYLQRGW